MRAVVTGANGFVGRRIVECLSIAGHLVRAAARQRPYTLPEGVDWVAAPDLEGDGGWEEIVKGTDVVVHCAARVHVMNETAPDPLAEFRRVNRDGTIRMARAAAAAGVNRMVFLSSIKVNGESTSIDKPFRASDEPRPLDPYAVSKLEAEQALFDISRQTGMEVAVVRPVLVYGPGVGANFRKMMEAISAGIPLPLGGIENRRSMVFAGNLADLVRLAVVHPAAAGKVLLVSDGEDLSTTELLRRLARAMRRPPRLLPAPTKLMLFFARLAGKEAEAQRLLGSLTVDIEDTVRALDWSPPATVDEGFAETVQAYQLGRNGAA